MEAVSSAGERGMTMDQKRKSVLRAAGTVLLVGCALVAWGATVRRDMDEERSRATLSLLLQRAALDASGGSNSSSTSSSPSMSGTDFAKMMEQYDTASDDELKEAGLKRGSNTMKDCTLTSNKGCMEENDRSFNALRYMIWKRQHDPESKADPEEQWANQAVAIAEKIAQEASSKASQEKVELDAALKDLSGKKKSSASAMQKMFVSQTAKQQALVSELEAEISKQKAELKQKEMPKLQLFELKTAKELKKVDADQRSKDAIAKSREVQAQKAAMARMEKRAKAKEEDLEDQISILKVNNAMEAKREATLKRAEEGDAARLRRAHEELHKAEATFRKQLVLEVTEAKPEATSLAETGAAVPSKKEAGAKKAALSPKAPAAAASATAALAGATPATLARANAGVDVAKKAVVVAASASTAVATKALASASAAGAATVAEKAPATSLSSVHLDDASF